MTTVVSGTHPTGSVLGQLVPVLPRLLRWQPLAVAVAAVVGLVAWKYGDVSSPVGAVWLMRFVGVFLVVGAVFLLDDPSSNVTAASPTTIRERSGARLAILAMGMTVCCLLPAAAVATAAPLAKAGLGLVVEIASIAAVACACSLALARWRGIAEPGQFAGLMAIGTMFAAHLAGARWPMLAIPGPEWGDAHLRWLGVLVVSLLVIIVCLRDPAAQHPRISRWL